jgi:hypothetical protein
MKASVFVIFFTLSAAVVGAQPAEWIGFDGESLPAEATIELMRATDDSVEFTLFIPGVSATAVSTDEGLFTRIEIPGLGRSTALGEPMLPTLRRFVEITAGANAAITVTPLDTESIDLGARGLAPRLYPVQLPLPKCDCPEADQWRFSYKADSYRGTVSQKPTLEGPFTFRDHEVMKLAVSPVSFDAAKGTLEVATRLRVNVIFQGGDRALTDARKHRLASPHFDAFLSESILNLDRDAGWAFPTAAPVEFLIITPPQFVAELGPFVTWKTSCGFKVNVVTTDVTGTTTTAIKSYITGLYNGPNPPVYILMIGDSPSPLATYTPSGGGTGGSDLPFVQMDSDLYPDMMIARWPIDDSTELANMRDKILEYEQPSAGSSAWMNRALFLAGDDYIPNGVTTHEDVMAELMDPPPNSAETELWYGDTENPTTAELIADLNTGRGWAVYSAHCGQSGMSGDPSFYSSDVPSLNNPTEYPIGIGHCCQSNMWNSSSDVFGEVTVTQFKKGFVSYWGGSNSTYWDEDDWLEKGFFDALFDEDMAGNLIDFDRQYSQIAACYAGLTEVTLQGGNEDYYWPMYNLNGDPTLDPFTRQPIAAIVGAPAVVPPMASDTFTVTVSDVARGPLPSAMVGVTQDGVLLGAGLTDDTGTATFHIDAPSPGTDLLVRVTAHNHLPTDAATVVAAGSDGVVVLDGGIYRCDATVGVDVFDEDLEAVFTTTLSASPSGGSTSVSMTDAGGAVVQYHGTATLGTDLVVAHGDTLTVTYLDADDGSGSQASKTATAAIDCAGPAISAVNVSPTEGTAIITYATGEAGTTEILYGTSMPPTTPVTDSGLATDHTVTLTGLDPCQTYYFSVASADALGNRTEDTNSGSYYSFQTDGWSTFLSESFDTDPGWTIDNGGSDVGWAFGDPTGEGQDTWGNPDPDTGVNGDYVYGVNLAGDVPAGLSDNQLKLTTPTMDLSNASSVRLRFQRWLGVERDTYDHARIRLSIDGGSSWTVVWENGGDTIDDNSWSEMIVDLPAAIGQSQVQIQWTYGATDGSWNYAGWNIDEVVVEGASPCLSDPPMFGDGFETGDCTGWSEEYPAP